MRRWAAINDASGSSSKNDEEETGPSSVNVEVQEAKAAREYSDALEMLSQSTANSPQWNTAKVKFRELIQDDVLRHEQLKLGPKIVASSWRNLASMEESEGNYEVALKLLLESVQLEHCDASIWKQIGRLAKQTNKLPLARFAFEQSVGCVTKQGRYTFWPALKDLIGVTYSLGDDEHASLLATQALRIDRSFVPALLIKLALCKSASEQTPRLARDHGFADFFQEVSTSRHSWAAQLCDERVEELSEQTSQISIEVEKLSLSEVVKSLTRRLEACKGHLPLVSFKVAELAIQDDVTANNKYKRTKMNKHGSEQEAHLLDTEGDVNNKTQTSEDVEASMAEKDEKKKTEEKQPERKRVSRRVREKKRAESQQSLNGKKGSRTRSQTEELFHVVYGDVLKATVAEEFGTDDGDTDEQEDKEDQRGKAELETELKLVQSANVDSSLNKVESMLLPATGCGLSGGSTISSSSARHGKNSKKRSRVSSPEFIPEFERDATRELLNSFASSSSSLYLPELLQKTLYFISSRVLTRSDCRVALFPLAVAVSEAFRSLAKFNLLTDKLFTGAEGACLAVTSAEIFLEAVSAMDQTQQMESSHEVNERFRSASLETCLLSKRLLDSIVATTREESAALHKLSARMMWLKVKLLVIQQAKGTSVQKLLRHLMGFLQSKEISISVPFLQTDAVISTQTVEEKLREFSAKDMLEIARKRFKEAVAKRQDEVNKKERQDAAAAGGSSEQVESVQDLQDRNDDGNETREQFKSSFTIILGHYLENPSCVPAAVVNVRELVTEKQQMLSWKGKDREPTVLEILTTSKTAVEGGQDKYIVFLVGLLNVLADLLSVDDDGASLTGGAASATIVLYTDVLLALCKEISAGHVVDERLFTGTAILFGFRALLLIASTDGVVKALLRLLPKVSHHGDVAEKCAQLVVKVVCWCATTLADVTARDASDRVKDANSLLHCAGSVALVLCHEFEGFLSAFGSLWDTSTFRILHGAFYQVCQQSLMLLSNLSPKQTPAWTKGLLLAGCCALKSVFEANQGEDSPMRLLFLARFVFGAVQKDSLISHDRLNHLGYGPVSRFADAVANERFISGRAKEVNWKVRSVLENVRQDALSDALFLLYGVLEFLDNDSSLNATHPGLFPSDEVASKRQTLMKDLFHKSSDLLWSEDEDESAFSCGMVGLPRVGESAPIDDLSLLMRFLLNYMESRSGGTQFDYKNAEYMKRLMRFLTARFVLECGTGPYDHLAKHLIRESSQSPGRLPFQVDYLVDCLTDADTRTMLQSHDKVSPREVCQRVIFYYVESVITEMMSLNPFAITKKSQTEAVEGKEKILAVLTHVQLDLGHNPWRFLSWFWAGQINKQLFRYELSTPAACFRRVFQYLHPTTPASMASSALSLESADHVAQGINRLDAAISCWSMAIRLAEQDLTACTGGKNALESYKPRRLDRVLTNFRLDGSDWEPAIISRLNEDGTFDLCMEEEDEMFFAVPQEAIKPRETVVETCAQDECIAELLRDCCVFLGDLLFTSLSLCQHVEGREMEPFAREALRCYAKAEQLFRERSDEEDSIPKDVLYSFKYMQARILEKLERKNPKFSEKRAILRHYRTALELAPSNVKSRQDIYKEEVLFRLHRARIKWLAGNQADEDVLQLVGAPEYMHNPKLLETNALSVKLVVKDCLSAFEECMSLRDKVIYAAHYRFAHTVLVFLKELGDEEQEMRAWLDKAIVCMDHFITKNPKASMCVILFPDYVIPFEHFEVPWYKMEVRRAKFLQLITFLYVIKQERAKLRSLLALLVDKRRWKEDLHKSTFLLVSCNIVKELQKMATQELLDVQPGEDVAVVCEHAFQVFKDTQSVQEGWLSCPATADMPFDVMEISNILLLQAYQRHTENKGIATELDSAVAHFEKAFPHVMRAVVRKSGGRSKSRGQSMPMEPVSSQELDEQN